VDALSLSAVDLPWLGFVFIDPCDDWSSRNLGGLQVGKCDVGRFFDFPPFGWDCLLAFYKFSDIEFGSSGELDSVLLCIRVGRGSLWAPRIRLNK
jgi:hypothetical protein